MATRGRKKGESRRLEIRDKILGKYYIVQDDRQYVLMKEGSTLAQGYYSRLHFLVEAVAKALMLDAHAGKTITLREYLNEYREFRIQLEKLLT